VIQFQHPLPPAPSAPANGGILKITSNILILMEFLVLAV
jgi:hypothetical protein